MSESESQKLCIEFAEWLFNNCYDNIYQDINKDGKTWVNHNNDDTHLYRNEVKRYSIKDIYKCFVLDSNK